jgi:hypothetical protein
LNVGGNKWKANLPPNTVNFENLLYNGERRLRPRLGGYLGAYLRVESDSTVGYDAAQLPQNANCPVLLNPNADRKDQKFECFDRFQYSLNDPIAATWKNLAPPTVNPCQANTGNPNLTGDIEILIFEQFSTSKLRVNCVDAAHQTIYLTGPTLEPQTNYTEDGFQPGHRYIVENVLDAFTEPGQFFLDHSVPGAWTVSYLARPGEDPNRDEVVIPQTAPPLLRTFNLHNVTFRGLTFQHDNYVVPYTGHPSRELESDIAPAMSIQDSQYVTVDHSTFRQISGTGLEILSCLPVDTKASLPPPLNASPAWCIDVPNDPNSVSTMYNTIQNSDFYDIGSNGIRIGVSWVPAETDDNIPQYTLVQNNTVEGYGRIVPASFGIAQGMGHDNTYTHNDVYDGYHCAISISQQSQTRPYGIGNANNIISFNHVYNLLQGIMSDGGSIRIEAGDVHFTASGNKILNNKIHDVSDASASLDTFGYGGNGIYLDNSTGLVDVENNLVYRVSDTAVYSPHGPAPLTADKNPQYNPTDFNTVNNNILAFARKALIAVHDPYFDNENVPNLVFKVSNNIMFFDRNASSPGTPFYPLGGCTYTNGQSFNSFQQFSSNLYWRTDGNFSLDSSAFWLQRLPSTSNNSAAPCGDPVTEQTLWKPFSFAQWMQSPFDEDNGSKVANPHFVFPYFPFDDFSLASRSIGIPFVPFNPNEAGRVFPPFLTPPYVPPTFATAPLDPWIDF